MEYTSIYVCIVCWGERSTSFCRKNRECNLGQLDGGCEFFERPNIAKVVFILSRFSREDTASKHGDLKTWIVKVVLYQKQRGNQSTKQGSWSCGNTWFFASIAQKTTGLTERNQICLQIRLAFRLAKAD